MEQGQSRQSASKVMDFQANQVQQYFFQALGRARKAHRGEIERLIDWLDSTIEVDRGDAAVGGSGCDDDTDRGDGKRVLSRLNNLSERQQTA
jgi:hypothetical protein